jgi:hypothetical protein
VVVPAVRPPAVAGREPLAALSLPVLPGASHT